MGQKDITERILESYNDVFADIVNVLVFHGEQVVSPDDLTDRTPYDHYKAAGDIHEEVRDIAKLWRNGQVRIACLGIENQEKSDADMPLRVIGYDGAEYRAQLLSENQGNDRYAVVTLVLYYGYKHRWNAPQRLIERIHIPDGMEHLVNDYRINLFQIAYLTREQVNMFRSDFRVVADYFVQKRENQDYIPGRQELRHVEAVLNLLRVFEGDHRFEDICKDIVKKPREGGTTTMCDVLDKAINQGREEGLVAGREEGLMAGREEERERSIRTMYEQGLIAGDIARFLQLELSYVQDVLAQRANE